MCLEQPGSPNDLVAMIQAKRQSRGSANDLIDKIAEKYIKQESKSGKSLKKSKKNDPDWLSGKNFAEDPMSDGEFQKLQAKLFNKK